MTIAEIIALARLAGGGGVSSWNDLTDKPFGEETTELFSKREDFNTQTGEFYTVFPFGEDIGVTLKTGETITIEWDGVLYDLEVGDPVYKIGNESLSGSGGDTGEPFFLNLATSTCYAKESGIHTFKTISKTIKTLDEKFIPDLPPILFVNFATDPYGELSYPYANGEPTLSFTEIVRAFERGTLVIGRLWLHSSGMVQETYILSAGDEYTGLVFINVSTNRIRSITLKSDGTVSGTSKTLS